MKRYHLLPANRGYTLGLIIFLAGSAVFLNHSISNLGQNLNPQYSQAGIKTLGPPRYREEGGRAYLWASGHPESDDSRWWDVTDASVDPNHFDHGIGVDRIPSIDAPAFAKPDDPEYAQVRYSGATPVIGVEVDGEARAYPISVMSRHELVNDTFGDTHLTVAW
jgi:hypothetical protein